MSARAIVTGGGRGLGQALTQALLARGHRVATTVRDPSRAEIDPRAIVVAMDVEDESSVRGAVSSAVEELGGLDLLINCAGTNAKSYPGAEGTIRLADLTAEPFLGIVRVNTVGPLLVARAALPALRESPAPRIVNISSWLGSIAGTTNGWNYAYAASKAALNMVSRILANELRDDGIAVLAVNPGWVRTDMGGPRADLTPEDSATGIVAVAEALTVEGSGRFLDWDGTEHPW